MHFIISHILKKFNPGLKNSRFCGILFHNFLQGIVQMGGIHYSSYTFQPVAYIRTAARYRYEEPRQSVFSPTPAQVEFLPQYQDALSDLDGVERIWIIAVFHLNVNPDRTANWNPKVRPPISPDNKKYGVYSTRSPHRPNPVSLSCVEVEKIEKNIIHLHACDLLDGTPVLDIKPYIPEVDAFPQSSAGWRDRLSPDEKWNIAFLPEIQAQADFLKENGAPDMISFCRIQLAYNPLDHSRKRLEDRGGGLYAIGCRTWRILFRADQDKKHITVQEIRSNYETAELLPGTQDQYGDKDLHRAFLSLWKHGGRTI